MSRRSRAADPAAPESAPRIQTTAAAAQSQRVAAAFHGRHGQGTNAATDLVTVEEPMEIRLAHAGPDGDPPVEQSISVTMRTPGDDFDLAAGFLLSEGIIRAAADIETIEHCGPPSPDKGIRNVVRVRLAAHVRFDADRLLRHFFTSSSCGVCGKASLDAVRVQSPVASRDDFRIQSAALKGLPAALRTAQTEFARTGGLHAAAAFDAAGRIRRVREDVGRHNALDKLLGAYLRADEPPLADRGVLLSGRASFELIQKVAMTPAALVAAIGPPSSLAVELAEDLGITLAGFLRADRFNVYVAPHRIA